MRTALFSIISPNYRHYARVLMASAAQHHPEWDRFVLQLGDASSGATTEPFTTVSVAELPLPDRRRFYFRYNLLELNTAVKPWMFEHLFARGYDRVIYLDPDIAIYSRLSELDAAPADTFLTLTPHLLASLGTGDDHPSDRAMLLSGTYNLGFLAVQRHSELARFLAWWQEKLEFQCVVETERGLFVDQKWMDLAPGLFPGVRILRHQGYNVAYWNLAQRGLSVVDGKATLHGEPLRFFHYSGFDPAYPSMVSKHDHRSQFADAGDARQLMDAYRESLIAAGYGESHGSPYPFGTFHDGTHIPNVARVLYRKERKLRTSAGEDPFAHPELFVGLKDPVRKIPLASRAGVRSYRALSRARLLVGLIPRPWRTKLREILLGRKEQKPDTVADPGHKAGLNIVGYLERPSGVGESARLCRNACESGGLPHHTIDLDRTGGVMRQAVYGVSLYHVNADQMDVVAGQLSKVFAGSRYNIGCWHWELPEFPDAWIGAASHLNEIWAPSAFVHGTLSRKLTIPIVHMPHGVEVTEIESCTPAELGVPAGRFTFLCMFDLASVIERKNPWGAVDAFRRAFPSDSAHALLVKVSNADRHPVEYRELQERLRGVPNVYLTDRMLSRARVNGLLSACDAVVSLHRSEGFGLILAEGMALGKPVIATGWSGNMDFMNSGNSCPIAYELVTLDRDHHSYPAGSHWAEPDLEHAAQAMRRIADDAQYRKTLGQRAQETIRSQFSPAAAVLRYRRRLALLGYTEQETVGR